MAAAPVCSVCVPTYNGVAFLQECLDSILGQSFVDFELLIVDDGSTDETLAVAAQCARSDSRVRVVSNERNLGLVGNWNRCVELARAPWIKFVFQDDLLAPRCLEQMLLLAGQSGRKLVFGNRRFIFDEGIAPATVAHYGALPTLESVCADAHDVGPADAVRLFLTRADGYFNFFGEPTSALVHREVFEAIGGFEPQLIQLCDLEYWLRASSRFGFARVRDTVASFRVHSGSTSQRNAARRAFRSSVLDRLIILHQLGYGQQFAEFRRSAEPIRPIRQFRKKLAHDAFWARNHARAAKEEPGMFADWQTVAAHFPKMAASVWLMPLEMRALFERHFAWRLGARR